MSTVLTPENGSNKMGFRRALISIAQARRFQQVGQQASLERLIAVDRDWTDARPNRDAREYDGFR
jgi:hypothetical protein